MVTISVIVPVYKVEPYLRRCVDSILAQTFTDFELILVDDGSPDHCPALCDEYAKQDNRVKVIHKSNGGVSSARNAGLDKAAGKYVTFVDSDDYIAEDWIEQLYKKMTSFDYDCVSGNYSMCGDMINNGACSKHHLVGNGHIFDAQDVNSFLINNIFSRALGWAVWTRIFKTSIIKENRLTFCETCENYAEDLGFVLAYTLYCRKVGFLPYTGYYYYIHPQSMMCRSKSQIKLKAVNEASKSFGNSIACSPWKSTAVEKSMPVFHYLIMETEYIKMYNGTRIIHLKNEMKKMLSDQWYSMQTDAFSVTQAMAMLPRAKEDVVLAGKVSKQRTGSCWVWYCFLVWCFMGKIYRKIKLLSKKNRTAECK